MRADGEIFLTRPRCRSSAVARPARHGRRRAYAKPIYVRADGRAPYAMVAQVMASLSSSGLHQHQPDHRHGRAILRRRRTRPRRVTGVGRAAPALLAAVRLLRLALFAAVVCLARSTQPLTVGASVPITIVSNAPTTAPAPSGAASPRRKRPPSRSRRPPTRRRRRRPPAPDRPYLAQAAAAGAAQAAARPRWPHRRRPDAAKAANPSRSPRGECRPAARFSHRRTCRPASPRRAPQAGAQTTGARKRPAAPLKPRTRAGPTWAGASQTTSSGLSQLLQRLWNTIATRRASPRRRVPVRFSVDHDGGSRAAQRGRPGALVRPGHACRRPPRLDAVHAAAPTAQTYHGKTITVNFDAKEACAKPIRTSRYAPLDRRDRRLTLAAASGRDAGAAPTSRVDVEPGRDSSRCRSPSLPSAAAGWGADLRGGRADLERSGLFRPLDPGPFRGDARRQRAPTFDAWKAIAAQALLVGAVSSDADGRLSVDFRLWDVYAGDQLLGAGSPPRPTTGARVAHTDRRRGL